MTQTIISSSDFANAAALHERERVHPLDDPNLFRGGLYSILSAVQDYGRHMSIYRNMVDGRMDTPQTISNNRDNLRRMMRSARFPNSKFDKVYGYAEWWPMTDLPQRLLADAQNGRENEFALRDELAEEAPGVGYKCASMLMRMCGYERVVPIDTWVLQFLQERGYDIPEYITIGGAKGGPYKKMERHISEIARRRGLNPGNFQLALWVKCSGWSPDDGTMPSYINS